MELAVRHIWTFSAVMHVVQSVVIGWLELHRSRFQAALLHPILDVDGKYYAKEHTFRHTCGIHYNSVALVLDAHTKIIVMVSTFLFMVRAFHN